MGWWAAIPYVVGGLASLMGGREQSKSAGIASSNAAAVRELIQQIFSPKGYKDISSLLAPGLFGFRAGDYAQPTFNQATGQWTMPTETTAGSPGNAFMGWFMNQMLNPGKMLPTTYLRSQEQIEGSKKAAQRGLSTAAGAKGLAHSSPALQALQAAIELSAGKQRGEAARDYGLAQEQLYRSDLAQASNTYMQLMAMIQNALAQKASAIGGVAIPQVAPVNPYSGITNFLGSLLSSGALGGGGQSNTGDQAAFDRWLRGGD